MTMHAPLIESSPWSAQLAQDDPFYRSQIDNLLKNSAFYKAKLGAAGINSTYQAGGLADIARLPFTEKDELRETRNEDHPIGTHLAVPMDDIVRIYSTSGTTGTPSYIPLTAGDLENWVEISQRSYRASGLEAG